MKDAFGTFSLVNVYSQDGNKITEGSWVQDHVGTLESATEAAIRTEEANSNKLDIAVIDSITCGNPYPSLPPNRIRLDVRRRICRPIWATD